jgi:hypothetical protein
MGHVSSHGDLQDACAELERLLEELGVTEVRNGKAAAGLTTTDWLLADADRQPSARHILNKDSKPPWNAAVGNCLLDTHELIRRLEASLRLAVTGHPGQARGGSAANTVAALRAIPKLAEAVSEHDRKQATRLLSKAAVYIGQLVSVDTAPKWEKIRAGPGGLPPRCPRCLTYSLRVSILSGIVICVNPGTDAQGCRDLDGNPMRGRLDLNRLDGSPVLAWRDGTVMGA